MKVFPAPRVYLRLFAIFLISLFSHYTNAQCPGLQAGITNGPLVNKCTGTPVTLQAEVVPGITSYQWQQQTTAGGPFENIAGATAGKFEVADKGSFRVVVGNGTCNDTSSITSIVQLALTAGSISGGPTAKICYDSYIGSLSGSAVPGDDGGVIKYQWQIKEGNGGYKDIPLATGVEYNAGYIKNNTTYRRAVRDNCGNEVYSNVLTFSIIEFVTPGILSPALQTINPGQTGTAISSPIAPVGSGNFTYAWQYAFSQTGPWFTIDGAVGASYIPTNITRSTYIRRTVYTDVCSYSATAEPVLVQMQNPLLLNAGNLYSDNACLFIGNTPYPIGTKIPPVGGILPYLIEWETRTGNGTWTVLPGQHGDKIFPGPINQSTFYRKKVTDAVDSIAYSDEVLLSVISTPLQPGEIAATNEITCIGSSPGQIISTKSAANFGERGSYQWQVKTGNGTWVDLPGATRGYYQPQPLTGASIFRRAFYDSCGPNGRIAYSNEVAIDTKPALFAGEISPSTQTLIPGRLPKKLLSVEAPHGGTNSYTIWWEKADLATGPFTKISGANSAEYQPPVAEKTAYYRRVVRDNNCMAEKVTFIIEVFVPNYPALVGGALSGSTCVFSGLQPAEVVTGTKAVSGGIAPYSFMWESRVGTGAFASIAGATTEKYQPAILTQTTQYRRKMTDVYGSFAYSDTFTINLITTALVPGKIEVENASICAGAAPGFIKSVQDASGFGTQGLYQWQQRIEGGSYTDIAGATAKEYAPGVLMQTKYFRRAYIDGCSGVTRTGYSNEVMIKATPATELLAGLIDGPFIACAGTTPAAIRSVLNACGSCNLVYAWEINTGNGWVAIPGANLPSYTPAAITVSTKYRRKVTDGLNRVRYSNEVEIMVYPALMAGTIGADSQVVCKNVTPGAIALLTDCHYTDGSVTYQWQSSLQTTGPWKDIAGANAPAYTPASATTTTYYRLKVVSTTCGAIAYTNVAVVIVREQCLVQISATSTSVSTCLPITKVALSYPVQPCNDDNIMEWEYQVGAATVWTATGLATNNFTINSFYQPNDEVIKWRLKMTNTKCNNISYSNILIIKKLTCRNTPAVYPNPSTAGSIIIIRSDDITHKISMMTIDGKRIPIKIISTARGFIKIQTPSSLPTGTYVLQISNANGQWFEKILIKNV